MRLLHGPLRIRLGFEGPSSAELAERVRREGVVFVGPGEEADLVAEPAPRPTPPPRNGEALSPRELEVLRLLVEGRSNAGISDCLGIGLRTVRFHLEGVYAKLGVGRRGEAVREGIRRGYVRFDA